MATVAERIAAYEIAVELVGDEWTPDQTREQRVHELVSIILDEQVAGVDPHPLLATAEPVYETLNQRVISGPHANYTFAEPSVYQTLDLRAILPPDFNLRDVLEQLNSGETQYQFDTRKAAEAKEARIDALQEGWNDLLGILIRQLGKIRDIRGQQDRVHSGYTLPRRLREAAVACDDEVISALVSWLDSFTFDRDLAGRGLDQDIEDGKGIG